MHNSIRPESTKIELHLFTGLQKAWGDVAIVVLAKSNDFISDPEHTVISGNGFAVIYDHIGQYITASTTSTLRTLDYKIEKFLNVKLVRDFQNFKM